MEFQRATLLDCGEAEGAVVVIDVLRAFSTAAYAFAAGVSRIRLVSSVDEALELRRQIPWSLVMGEVKGLPVPGFDFSNSPPQFDGLNLRGRLLIQRTTSGTQGAVRSRRAQNLLAASFVNAAATALAIQRRSPARITFVITGRRTFSACQNLTNYLDRVTRAVFVGEPAGSRPNFTGEDTNVLLPWSGLALSISSRWWQDSYPGDQRPYVPVAMPVAYTAADWRQGRDPVLAAPQEYFEAP